MSTNAPSGYRVQQAVSTWQSARARVLADEEIAHDDAALTAMLGPEDGDVRDILARLLSVAQHATKMADGASEMIADLDTRRHRYKRRAEWSRGVILAIMDVLGEKKAEFPHGTVSVRAGLPQVHPTDEDAIPDRFFKTTTVRKLDKAALLTALRDGEVIDGAEISNTAPSIVLRSK
jgi:hypothetical protein